jgi:hypothetical protein
MIAGLQEAPAFERGEFSPKNGHADRPECQVLSMPRLTPDTASASKIVCNLIKI